MNIGGRAIGPGQQPYVVAEVGVNHDGDAVRALALTEQAAACGADAVKFQFFETDRLLSSAAKLAMYQRSSGETDPSEMLRRLELPIGALAECCACAHERGIHAIVSVFSLELVDAAVRGGPWDALKTASPDIVNKPLLGALCATGLPMIVSTGTATDAEVARASEWLVSCADCAFLHCVSAYPTPPEDASLRSMSAIASLTGRAVGYSDHTTREDTGAIAVAAGACILEKHFSYDRSAIGPDHAASLEPDGFARYVEHVRTAYAMLGDARKSPRAIEGDVRSVSRQSVVTTRPIAPGERVTREDLTIKRPGTGIEPWRIDDVVGVRAVRAIGADQPIVEDDLERATG